MENNQLVLTQKLTKVYTMGQHQLYALKEVDLRFGQSEFSGLVGPSGSGKTTFLNIVGSLDVPSKGKVEVLGRRIETLSHKEAAELRKRHIGFIFQTFNLLPVYTVFENVEFPLILLGVPAAERRQRVMEALEWVRLVDRTNSRPAQLSGGECQRVAIARAIAKKPALILADEPTANLDAENSHNILQIMAQLNQELGTTFIFATHDEKVIGYLKRKITLVDGQVTKDEIYSSPPGMEGHYEAS